MYSPLFLGVLEPPSIQEKPQVVEITRGDSVSLECRLAGTPQISVRSTKDGKKVQLSGKYNLYYENNVSSPNIQSTQQEDEGMYQFEATNAAGACSGVAVLGSYNIP